MAAPRHAPEGPCPPMCVEEKVVTHTYGCPPALSLNPAALRLHGAPSVTSTPSPCAQDWSLQIPAQIFPSAPSDAQVPQAHTACASPASRAGSLCPSCAGILPAVPTPSRVPGEGRGSSAGEDKLLKRLDMQAAEAFPGSQEFLEVGSWCQRTSLGELHG